MTRRPYLRYLYTAGIGFVGLFGLTFGWGVIPGSAAADEIDVDPAIRPYIKSWVWYGLLGEDLPLPGQDSVRLETLPSETLVYAYHHLDDLTGIEHCHSLERLYASAGDISIPYPEDAERRYRPTDLSRLAGLPALREVVLPDQRITNLVPLTTLHSLVKLDLSFNPVDDYSPLGQLEGLQSLRLGERLESGKRRPSKWRRVSDLPVRRTQVGNLASVALPSTLTELALPGLKLDRLDLLTGCSDLRSLDAGMTNITSLRPLLNCRQLEDLWIDHNNIKDPELLVELPKLKAVAIDVTREDMQSEWMIQLKARGVRVEATVVPTRGFRRWEVSR